MKRQDLVVWLQNHSSADIVSWACTADYFDLHAALLAAAEIGAVAKTHALADVLDGKWRKNPELYGEILAAVCGCTFLSAEETLTEVRWLLDTQQARPNVRSSVALCHAIATHKHIVVDALLPFCTQLHCCVVLRSAVAANNPHVVNHLLGGGHPILHMDTLVAQAVACGHMGLAERLLTGRHNDDDDFAKTLVACVENCPAFLSNVFGHCSQQSVNLAVGSFSSRFLYDKADILAQTHAQYIEAQKNRVALAHALADASPLKGTAKRM